MKLIQEYSGALNVVVLICQLLLLYGQFQLSKQINKQSIARERGYFLISNTNMPFLKGQEKRYQDHFNLREGITFYVSGNSDVIVTNISYSVDERIYIDGTPRSTYFTTDKRANTLWLLLDLNESQYQKQHLDVVTKMNLKNPSGYKYTEISTMRFVKESTDADEWILDMYGISFV